MSQTYEDTYGVDILISHNKYNKIYEYIMFMQCVMHTINIIQYK